MQVKQAVLEEEAISIVKFEKTSWETATAFVTERVAFNMRNLIRQLQKNYWGIFQDPKDPQTGRDKIWIPLTEYLVEAAVKNIDIDTKDVNFRAKNPNGIRLVPVIRNIVRNYLSKIGFGEKLDDFERRLAIEGTAVWKTIETYEDGKKTIEIIPVPLLNIFIDPTAESIQKAYRFTERSLMTANEIEAMSGWINTKGLEGRVGLNRNDASYSYSGSTQGTSKYIDVYELWGKIPKSLITGNTEDKTTEINGHIVVSGLETPGKERVHLLEENTKQFKPYEEAWYTRVPGRWYGKGVAEKVMWLQVWMNTIVNIRINRSYVSQLGIFKIKKGAGVTPQMIGRLSANGALLVNSMDDIEQMAMQEASQSSYTDEQNIVGWGQKVTSAYESLTGESLPASTPATNAAISNQNAQSQFILIREGIGMFLERYLDRHAIPVIMQSITKDSILRITGADPSEIAAWDECLVNETVYAKLDEMNSQGLFVDPMQVDFERQRAIAALATHGEHRYSKVDKIPDFTEYDVKVYITNEEFDKGVMTQNLLTALQLAPEYKESILQQVFDLMGLDSNTLRASQSLPQLPQPNGQPALSPTMGATNPQASMTAANTYGQR